MSGELPTSDAAADGAAVDVRSARGGDAPRLAVLWEAAGLHSGRVPVADQLNEVIRHGPDLALVVPVGDGVLAGSLLGAYDGRRGWVNRLAVHPEHQGRGVGGALLDTFEERLRQRGCRKVNLLIRAENTGVSRFYAGHGYAAVPLTFMEKWLD